MNEKLEKMLNDFVDPYSNDKVIAFMDMLRNSGKFFEAISWDIEQFLITKQGCYSLEFPYTEKDYEFMQYCINKINKEITN